MPLSIIIPASPEGVPLVPVPSSSSLSLNASDYITNVSTNTGDSASIKKDKASSLSLTDELKKLKELLDSGAITKEEFKKAKDKLLN